MTSTALMIRRAAAAETENASLTDPETLNLVTQRLAQLLVDIAFGHDIDRARAKELLKNWIGEKDNDRTN